MPKICVHCKGKMNDTAKFCPNCGASVQQQEKIMQSQPPLSQSGFSCPGCGAINKFGSSFCKNCGRPLPKSSPTGQFQAPPQPKKYGRKTPLILSGTALFLVVVLITGLWKPGFVWNWVDEMAYNGFFDTSKNLGSTGGQDISLWEPTMEPKYIKDKEETVAVSPDQPIVAIDEVAIDFGEYSLDAEESLNVTSYETESYDDGLSVATYDIALGEHTDFNDVITIRLPYDPKLVDMENEKQSVGAKYYNEEEEVWEDVVYTVDTDQKTVNITTTHLSLYSVFMVNNDKARTAYITTIFSVPSSGNSNAILQEYIENGSQPGPLAEEAGWNAVGEILNISNVNNLANAAATVKDFQAGALPSYTFELTSELGSITRWVGLSMTFYTLAEDGMNCKDDHSKREMVTNVTKNIMYNAADFFGTSAIQISFIGVLAIDYALSSFGKQAMAERLKNTETVYKYYYNQSGVKRELKDWRQRIIQYIEQNQDHPERAMELLEQDIDNYCNQFWGLSSSEQNFLAGEAGLKIMSWPNSHDQGIITQNFNAQIHQDLYPVYVSVQNYLKAKVQADAMKRLGELRNYLNQKIYVEIHDLLDEDDKAIHQDYIVRFEPLASEVDENSWTGRMPEDGTMNTYFTLLGHLQAGSPTKLALYKPGDQPGIDEPEMIVPFSVSKPRTVINIPDMELSFEDILGEYDTVQEVEGFNSSMLDGLIDQMPEGYDEFLDMEAYKDYYNQSMDSAIGTYDGQMRIEKIEENVAKVVLISSSSGQEMETVYEGVWDNGILHLKPDQALAGDNWDLIFKKDNQQVTCEGENSYDSELVSYSFTFSGTKRE